MQRHRCRIKRSWVTWNCCVEEMLDFQLRSRVCAKHVTKIQLRHMFSALLLKTPSHMQVQCGIRTVPPGKSPPMCAFHTFQILRGGGGQNVPSPMDHVSLNEAYASAGSLELAAQGRQRGTALQGTATHGHFFWSLSQTTLSQALHQVKIKHITRLPNSVLAFRQHLLQITRQR